MRNGGAIQNPVAIILLPATSTPNGGFFNSDGLKFPATQVVSTDPNTLDDYEEGTYTPTWRGDGTAGAPTYTLQAGEYIKIGRLCYITHTVTISAIGGMLGNLQQGGLPFTSSNVIASALGIGHGICSNTAAITYSAGQTTLMGRIAANSALLNYTQAGSAVAGIQLPITGVGAAGAISGSNVYSTSA